MLSHLRVSNLGILTEAAIDPSPGFTVITGETGAGKTLLLGGLRLILGGKADAGAVGPADDTAQADGVFVDGDDEIGVSRIVPRSGRSRAPLSICRPAAHACCCSRSVWISPTWRRSPTISAWRT